MDLEKILKKMEKDRLVFVVRDLKEHIEEDIHSIKLSGMLKKHMENNKTPQIDFLINSPDGSKIYYFKKYFEFRLPYFNEPIGLMKFNTFFEQNEADFKKIITSKLRDKGISINDEFLLDINDKGEMEAKIQKRVKL